MRLFWIRFETEFLYLEPPFTVWLTAQGRNSYIYCGHVFAKNEQEVKEALEFYCYKPRLRFCIEKNSNEKGTRFEKVDKESLSLKYLPQQFQGANI